MNKILGWFTGGVVKEVGKVIDGLFTSDEERLKAKNEVFKVLQEQQLELQKLQTEIVQQKQMVIGYKEVGDLS